MYYIDVMIVNERIKQIRLFRGLTSKELARKARISPAEVSLLERRMRQPKIETLQRIAAALEVSSSYLLSEIHYNLPIEVALAKESLQIFLRDQELASDETQRLFAISNGLAAPTTVRGWQDLIENLAIYQRSR
jgi:transcriptional regulator with XRE-family HTH domain